MAAQVRSRRYEMVLWGSTGFTGKLTAKYILDAFPKDFEWAIAGRSQDKLCALTKELEAINPSESIPGLSIWVTVAVGASR